MVNRHPACSQEVSWHAIKAFSESTQCLAHCSLEAFSSLMNEAAALLVRKLDAAAKDKQPVDIHNLLGDMTMGVVGTTAFGYIILCSPAECSAHTCSCKVGRSTCETGRSLAVIGCCGKCKDACGSALVTFMAIHFLQ